MDWLIEDLGDFAGRAGPKTRTFFLLTLMLVEFLPLFFGFFGRMSRLPIEKRLAYLEKLDHSAIAAVIALPKALLGLIYYEHPEALLETGYDHQSLIPFTPRSERT